MAKNFFGVFICWIFFLNYVSANPYDGDRNFIYVYDDTYLDLRTINVQRNSPPYFIVKGAFVHFNSKSGMSSVPRNVTMKFDLLGQNTFYLNKTGYWELNHVYGNSASNTMNKKISDALFKAAFGRDFYGENFKQNSLGINEAVPELSINRLALGGIQIGASFERVLSIYGSPDNVKHLIGRNLSFWSGNSGEIWTYGDSFEITFIDGTARVITSNLNNGIKTADGISVGDDAEKLWRIYGQAYSSTKNAYLYCNSIIYIKFTMNGEKISAISLFVDG